MRFLNRAQESFTTTGTGTLTLGGAPTGWRTFAAALNADFGLSGTVTFVGYFAVSADEATWEFGYGTVDTAAGTITRNLIASTTGSAINWPSGTKYIFSTPEAIHFTKMFELHRGSTAPATARAGTPWLDTNAGVTDVRFKIYDGADWNALFSIDETNNRVYPLDLTGAKIGGAQVDLASATTPALGGTASDRVRITGTTTITGFGTVADGVRRFVRFAGALTLTYHATSLILPGSANITTAADDEALFVSLGSGNWKCLYFTKRDGTALVAPAAGTPPLPGLSPDGVVKYVTAATVDIDADWCVVDDGSGNTKRLSAINLTANIASSGANGLDTGAEGSSRFYFVYVIYNGTTTASLLSESATAPTMPSGYTYKALVGAIRNDGSSNFVRIWIQNRRAHIPFTNVLAATAVSSANTYQSLSISDVVPSIAKTASGNFGAQNAADPTAHGMRVAGDANGVGENLEISQSYTGTDHNSFRKGAPFRDVPLITAQTIYWTANNTQACSRIDISGWTF